MIIKTIAWCLAGPAVLIIQASASPMSMGMFGHIVEIRTSTGGQEQLVVDERVLLKDQYISFEQVAVVDGVPSVVGQRSAGGNACEGSTFILSFPATLAARIDGPLDTCNPNETRVEEKQIVVRVAPTPQTLGSQWTWSPSFGFSAETPIEFVAKHDDGWAALRSRLIDHPAGLLNYNDFSRLIDMRLGRAREAFVSMASGPGSAQYRNNLLVATSCRAHSCGDTSLLVVMDIVGRKVFVALKDGSASPLIAPSSGEWPAGARSDLNAFQKRWQR